MLRACHRAKVRGLSVMSYTLIRFYYWSMIYRNVKMSINNYLKLNNPINKKLRIERSLMCYE